MLKTPIQVTPVNSQVRRTSGLACYATLTKRSGVRTKYFIDATESDAESSDKSESKADLTLKLENIYGKTII